MAHRNVGKMQAKLRAKQLPEKTICFTAIMRNESMNVNRVLDSAKSFINFVSIVDTGSTDNTIDVINQWCKRNNIKGKVHQEPFQNFGYNRTHSIIKAKESFPTADYFLLSDADFVWKVNRPDFKKYLFAHKILIPQKSRDLYYTNIRLLSSKVEYSCIGVTHEFWQENPIQSTFKDTLETCTINAIEIDDREDGGCKSDKFERDKRLLVGGLADDTISHELRVRYTFYLAQTLKCLHEYEESIKVYQERIAFGGWYEEVYYSYYQVGLNYKNLSYITRDLINIKLKNESDLTEDNLLYLKNWSKEKTLEELQTQFEDQIQLAQKWFMDGLYFCPSRAESLYHCTVMLRDFSRHKLAYECAVLGKKIKFPTKESLFIENDAYSWGFDYELSIVCSYLGKTEEGLQVSEALLIDDRVPYHIKATVEKNLKFYL